MTLADQFIEEAWEAAEEPGVLEEDSELSETAVESSVGNYSQELSDNESEDSENNNILVEQEQRDQEDIALIESARQIDEIILQR